MALDLSHDTSACVDEASVIVARLRDLGLEVPDFDEIFNDDLSSIKLPVLKYGYPQCPFTWERLKAIIIVERDLAKLARSSEQQRSYEMFRYCLKREYASVLDYVLLTKFKDFTRRRGVGEDKRWYASPPINDYWKVETTLVENDFPYFMADGILHFILWKTNESIQPRDIDNAKAELRRAMPILDTLHWINPPHLQSLPEIDHVHILCRFDDATRT
jgi:Protein of unknown function (DUF3605)